MGGSQKNKLICFGGHGPFTLCKIRDRRTDFFVCPNVKEINDLMDQYNICTDVKKKKKFQEKIESMKNDYCKMALDPIALFALLMKIKKRYRVRYLKGEVPINIPDWRAPCSCDVSYQCGKKDGHVSPRMVLSCNKKENSELFLCIQSQCIDGLKSFIESQDKTKSTVESVMKEVYANESDLNDADDQVQKFKYDTDDEDDEEVEKEKKHNTCKNFSCRIDDMNLRLLNTVTKAEMEDKQQYDKYMGKIRLFLSKK
jgi:hypothetical protein